MGFSGPPRHHVIPQPLPRALLFADFVFVGDDASKPPLSPLYRGPYRVLHRSEKFVVLQIGDKSDSVSVDRLKPVFSSEPISPAVPPPCGRPARRILDPALRPPELLSPPSATRAVCIRRTSSAITPPFLLRGVLWQNDVCHSIPEFQELC